jgi:hypothetical protein
VVESQGENVFAIKKNEAYLIDLQFVPGRAVLMRPRQLVVRLRTTPRARSKTARSRSTAIFVQLPLQCQRQTITNGEFAGKKVVGGQMHYWVDWEPTWEPTLEPLHALGEARSLMRKFEAKEKARHRVACQTQQTETRPTPEAKTKRTGDRHLRY